MVPSLSVDLGLSLLQEVQRSEKVKEIQCYWVLQEWLCLEYPAVDLNHVAEFQSSEGYRIALHDVLSPYCLSFWCGGENVQWETLRSDGRQSRSFRRTMRQTGHNERLKIAKLNSVPLCHCIKKHKP